MSAKRIGKCLQSVRRRNRLNQKQMSGIVGISVSHYSLIEKREISPSILEVLIKVCNKFNLNLDYFLNYPEAEIYSHDELPTPEEDELIMIMSMYLKKLDLKSLKILYSIVMLLDNTKHKNSTIQKSPFQS